MERDAKTKDTTGISISIPVPAQDANIFTHKATDDVLLFLSRHRFNEYSIGTVADRVGHPKQSVRRAVDMLTANDLIKESPEGNRRLIRINRDRLTVPDDPFLRIPQSEFHDPVRTAVDELTSVLDDVIGIVLFGSVARGEADRRSDIDLWVLVRKNRAANQRAANTVERDLEERRFDGDRYGYDIDVEAINSVPTYTEDIREIVLSGIAVYETSDFELVENLLLQEADGDE
jgi:predicted nucleotidyltransferase